jgi:hypothetical protein
LLALWEERTPCGAARYHQPGELLPTPGAPSGRVRQQARTPTKRMSPTARTLAQLTELGYQAQKVEHTVPKPFIKRDLFGADIVALKQGEPILAVQATTCTHVAARIAKLRDSGHVELWRSVGAAIEVWAGARSARADTGKPGSFEGRSYELCLDCSPVPRQPRRPAFSARASAEYSRVGRLAPTD